MSEHVIDSIADERDRLREENEALRKRIKRLIDAGDAMYDLFVVKSGTALKWERAKESK